MLKASGITKEEAVEHPQAVLDALAFHMDGPAPPAAKQGRPKMPTKEDVTKTVTEVSYQAGRICETPFSSARTSDASVEKLVQAHRRVFGVTPHWTCNTFGRV